MRTLDTIRVQAPAALVFAAATNVTAWPAILPHYRWVRVLESDGDQDLVEMAAWRPFGFIKYPTWWVSRMAIDEARLRIRYRHVRGITRGMEVEWSVEPTDGDTLVSIVHDWDGPAWPLIRRPAAEWVIGPVFIHGIASRTLAGIARHVEQHA